METPKIPPSEIITQPPHVSFGVDKVPPPAPAYVAPSAQLFFQAFSIVGSVQVTYAVMARLLRFDGQVIPFEKEFLFVNGNGSALIPLAEGFLLQVSVRLISGFILSGPGETYCILNIRQTAGPTFVDQPLIADYVTPTYNPSWPTGRFAQPQQDRGSIRAGAGGDPAAGAEISVTVPTGARWRLISFTANLITSGVVVNRRVALVHDDGVNVYARAFCAANILASSNVFFTWADSYPVFANFDNQQMSALPGQDMLIGGFRIRTLTLGLDAGDNWGPPQFLVEEWVDI